MLFILCCMYVTNLLELIGFLSLVVRLFHSGSSSYSFPKFVLTFIY